MKPIDERFEHQLLDRFEYTARKDDGYGPNHPRVGDVGVLRMHDAPDAPYQAFEVVRDRVTGLPILMVDDPIPETEDMAEEPMSLHGPGWNMMDMILTERAVTGTARLVEPSTWLGTVYEVSPAFDDCCEVAVPHDEDGRPFRLIFPLDDYYKDYVHAIDVDAADDREALKLLGYELQEPAHGNNA